MLDLGFLPVLQHCVACGQVLGAQVGQVVADGALRVGGQVDSGLFNSQGEAVEQFRQFSGGGQVILIAEVGAVVPVAIRLESPQQRNRFFDAESLKVNLLQTGRTCEIF